MNDLVAYLYVGFFLIGIVISVLCGVYWQRNRFLHLIPLAYGVVYGCSFGIILGWPSDWVVAVVFGLAFYSMAWISWLSERRR
jgi:hypothetical protein